MLIEIQVLAWNIHVHEYVASLNLLMATVEVSIIW